MISQHCDHEMICRLFRLDSRIAYNDGTPCMKNHDGCQKCTHDSRQNKAPQENQILVTFKDKATVDYILLVSRRKGYDLGDYIEGNFEWDDMLPCIDKINPEDCQFCDFREQCPDRVGGA